MNDVMLSQGNGLFEWTDEHRKNLECKQKFVSALFVGDWEEMARLVTDDVELREPDSLPFGGIYKGLEGFRECWDKIPQVSHKTTSIETLHTFMTADPNHLWVELDCKMIRNDNGRSMDQIVMEKFEFRDNRISAIILHWYDIPRDLRKG
ncbi:MAG: nuclear transport factor 2 family protein [Novosphingobium sp.]|nr:nuclear transport factor 2 family protein [Novosphingobium sp.]